MARAIIKKAGEADERRPFVSHGEASVLNMGALSIGRGYFEPGWRWSEHVKPIANTESCEVVHTLSVLSGRLHIRMNDGQELDLEPGDVAFIPSGHDAWVVGDEPCRVVDFTGAEDYAVASKQAEEEPAQPSLQ
ncbi:cupin domain-containing protein [Corallococcus sp. AB049A]|uniref:Cupin domain-containing protein n=1 Tax=Corallococcus interemptor TaxID=2316720 RepID=A0A3A8Q6Q0_9BACT|nr:MULTISPECIES: cupin domain-containing protein [Corallococcus]RKH62640.1 cupin domain-containing protein [Corallococcus interemptor]RKI44746.1 cupin domain-containing protein [Corallococcus sp. AB049A]